MPRLNRRKIAFSADFIQCYTRYHVEILFANITDELALMFAHTFTQRIIKLARECARPVALDHWINCTEHRCAASFIHLRVHPLIPR